MSTPAIVFMITSVGFVASLMAWCFARVLRAPEKPSEVVKDFHNA